MAKKVEFIIEKSIEPIPFMGYGRTYEPKRYKYDPKTGIVKIYGIKRELKLGKRKLIVIKKIKIPPQSRVIKMKQKFGHPFTGKAIIEYEKLKKVT